MSGSNGNGAAPKLGKAARLLEIAKPVEVDVLQLGEARYEVKSPRVASYGKFLALSRQVSARAQPEPAADGAAPAPAAEVSPEELRARFDASIDLVLLCVPGLERGELEDLAFEDFQRVVEFVTSSVSAEIAAREKAGLSNPFSSKPSPSGDTSGSGSRTSATSTPATSAS